MPAPWGLVAPGGQAACLSFDIYFPCVGTVLDAENDHKLRYIK